MVATSPSTFAHSCEEAYFLSSDTAAASMQTGGAMWLLHSSGPKRTKHCIPRSGRRGTKHISHLSQRVDAKGMTVGWGPWQRSAPYRSPQNS